MILTLTANPALDVTYPVHRLIVGGSHRVHGMRERAGGKGINVAAVLAQEGYDALALGPIGDDSGAALLRDLDERGIDHAMTLVRAATRRTVNVVSAAEGEATIFNEAGALLTAPDWGQVLGDLERALRDGARVLTISGSLPPGLPMDAYAAVITLARRFGCRTILDSSGTFLPAALEAGPDVIKPNLTELREATGTQDALSGARLLQEGGARAVLVSRGPDGLLLLDEHDRVATARLAAPLQGNPTGAGDAVVAAVAAGFIDELGWPEILRNAVAWSAAAVLAPVAGEIDQAAAIRIKDTVIQGDS